MRKSFVGKLTIQSISSASTRFLRMSSSPEALEVSEPFYKYKTGNTFWTQVIQEMLNPRKVCISCRRCTIFPSTIILPEYPVLQNTLQNGGEKEAGKVGAEFPPDPLSAPTAFWSRSLDEKCLNDSANIGPLKQKNFLFSLKDRCAKKLKNVEIIFLSYSAIMDVGWNRWNRI